MVRKHQSSQYHYPLLLLGRTAVSATPTSEEIAQNALGATVLLTMTDANDRAIAYGSGFFVLSNVIATNFHVIDGAHGGTARPLAQNKSYTLGRILKSDEIQDLALIEVSAPNAEPLPIGDSGSRSLRIGAKIYVAGNPRVTGGGPSPKVLLAPVEAGVMERKGYR